MYPDNDKYASGAIPGRSEPVAPPVYPTPEFYRDLAEKGSPATPTYQPLPPTSPWQPVNPRPPRIRTHNAFSRFIINWGGWRRLLISLGSAALSVFVWAFLVQTPGGGLNWQFGLGFVGLIAVHELGHAFALRLKKLPATFPIFIPGIGAYVSLPNRPISLRDGADIALAGPFLGGVGSLFCLIMFFVNLTPTTFPSALFWLNLAFFGFLLNLANLLPVLPLDGGFVGKTLSRWLAPIGLAIIALLFYYTQNFFVLLIGFYGLNDTLRSFNQTGRQVIMRAADRVTVALMYGGLILLLAFFLYLGISILQSVGYSYFVVLPRNYLIIGRWLIEWRLGLPHSG